MKSGRAWLRFLRRHLVGVFHRGDEERAFMLQKGFKALVKTKANVGLSLQAVAQNNPHARNIF